MNGRIPLVCVGSGAALGRGRQWSSLLIDDRILLDLPPTTVPQIYRLKRDLTAIDYIFISHLHGDHLFGLPFLLLEYCMRHEREKALHIIGPPGLEEAADQLCRLAWPEMRSHGFEPHVPIVYTEVSAEAAYRAGDLAFTAIPMAHFDLAAYGYRFEYEGRAFAYTGDTGECEQLTRLLRGADVAIIECTHAALTNDPGHMDAEAVARLTEELRERGATILATHLTETPAPIDGVTVCEDDCTYWV